MFRRRRILSAEETAANAARKQQKIALSKTCQCCWRQIFAETGTIAHHGYQRPGWGYQTASCMGAKHAPLEFSRNRLGDLIKVLEQHEVDQVEHRRKLDAEEIAIKRIYTNYNGKRVQDRKGRSVHPTVVLAFTRANFEQLVDENTGPRGSDKLWNEYDATYSIKARGFDDIKTRELAHLDDKLKGLREHLAECRARFDGWKQTHKFIDNQWVAA